MANPLNVACAANAWTKVTTSQTAGSIINKKTNVSYMITTRDTGQAAPTLSSEGRRAFISGPVESFSYAATRDVYIFAHGSVAGLVEVTV